MTQISSLHDTKTKSVEFFDRTQFFFYTAYCNTRLHVDKFHETPSHVSGNSVIAADFELLLWLVDYSSVY